MPYEDDTASSSSSDEDERRERKKAKKEKKEKKEKKSKHKSKKDKKEKRDKKEKKSKHKKGKDAKGRHPDFGKYGILGPQDRYHKQQEFYAWLRDVKGMDPELQPPGELVELFSDFAEDFNTVTLPHKKYYNLEGWEAKQVRKRKASDAAAAAAAPAVSVVDDERALKARHAPKRSKMGMSRNELLEMQKIMRERDQSKMQRDLGQKVDDKLGVRTQSMMRGLVAPGTKTV